ncbi:hypothetical protein [Nonlabens sp. Asnod3-A02]|uniref:hypothetical protein n=1 Tax=Nonlabens sp. Asnod3-A02 TaxID=3160579 RepID=UPI00386405E9
MSVRDLFRLVFKSIGVVSLFYVFISLFSLVFPIIESENTMSILLMAASLLLVSIAIYFVFFVFVDQLITVLKLDKGFDTTQITLGAVKTEKIFEVILFTLGMMNIIDVLPDFLHWMFKKFQSDVSHSTNDLYLNDFYSGSVTYDITYDIFYLLIGLLVILLRKQIIKLLD